MSFANQALYAQDESARTVTRREEASHASKEAGDAKVSDEDVKAAIQLALQGSHFVLDDLSVRVDHGVVFLDGSVKSWLAKQRVSTLVWSVSGVADVVDTIDVRPPRFSVVPLQD